MSSDPALARQFQRAFAAHQAGDLAAARAGYAAVLKAQPLHFDAVHMQGVAALQAGEFAEAARSIERAVQIHQNVALAWNNLAAAYRGLGRPADAAECLARKLALAGEDAATLEALADLSLAAGRLRDAQRHYERLLALQPRHAGAAVGWGIALRELGQPNEALQSFERALAIDPTHLRAANNIGITLGEQQRHAEALAQFDRLLAREPAYAPAHNARALSLWKLDRLDEAEHAYGRAIEISPNYVDAYSNRGALLASRGRETEALHDYQRAIALQPRQAEAHNGLGALRASQHRIDEAIEHYRQAIACRPEFAQAHSNLGVALVELGQVQEALASYNRAIDLQHGSGSTALADALANRGGLWARLRHYTEAAADARTALAVDADHPYTLGNALYFELMQCDWQQRAQSVALLEQRTAAGDAAATPFVTLAVCGGPALQLASARRYAAAVYPPREEAPLPARAQGRIRLAWLSADFHDHATAHLITGLLEQIDKTRFELTGLSFGPVTGDRYQQRLQRVFDRFIDVQRSSDADVAQRLRELGTDIAVDLKGFTNGGRPGIFSHRAAPVQVSYLGYPGTTGMPQVDYMIADHITVPAEHEMHYSERIVRLPHCYQCNDAGRAIAARRFSRAELNLPPTGFVFCCFNNSYKITPEVFDVWMRLLRQVDGSVLWLLQDNSGAVDNLRREASARDVTPERLVFAARLPVDEHLARHDCADLFLDTWPVNAHTTASDALWAGLPLVTLLGSAFAGRVAASLLHAIGRSDCVAVDTAGYEALALALARDPARLAALRSAVHRAREDSALFDTPGFTRDIERAFLHMHARQLAGLPPESFDL